MSCYPASPRLVVRRLIWTWGLIKQVVVTFDWMRLNCAIGADLEEQSTRLYSLIEEQSTRKKPESRESRVIGRLPHHGATNAIGGAI